MPMFSALFLVITFSSIAVPGTNGFVGEFLVLLGTFKGSLPLAFGVLAATGVILGAVYMLWMVQRVFFGQVTHRENLHLKDLTWRELATVLPFVVLVLVMGLIPQPFLERLVRQLADVRGPGELRPGRLQPVGRGGADDGDAAAAAAGRPRPGPAAPGAAARRRTNPRLLRPTTLAAPEPVHGRRPEPVRPAVRSQGHDAARPHLRRLPPGRPRAHPHRGGLRAAALRGVLHHLVALAPGAHRLRRVGARRRGGARHRLRAGAGRCSAACAVHDPFSSFLTVMVCVGLALAVLLSAGFLQARATPSAASSTR